MITTVKYLSLTLLGIGVFILMQVTLPIISFKIWEIRLVADGRILSPEVPKEQVLGITVQTGNSFPAFISNLKRETMPGFDRFNLTVFSLDISKADVFVDSNDLSKGLAHLPGTALPGEKGNVFISGHSSLPVLSKGSAAYFAGLSNVKKGDSIILTTSGSEYRYKVVDIKLVKPEETWVINPPDDKGRYVTLMTCVPPGLNTKRLIVLGKMI